MTLKHTALAACLIAGLFTAAADAAVIAPDGEYIGVQTTNDYLSINANTVNYVTETIVTLDNFTTDWMLWHVSGGGTGSSLIIQNQTLYYTTSQGSTVNTAQHTFDSTGLAGSPISIVTRSSGTTDLLEVWLNGALVASAPMTHSDAIGAASAGVGKASGGFQEPIAEPTPLTLNIQPVGNDGDDNITVRTWDQALSDEDLSDSTSIPEPATLALLGLGTALVLTGRRRA